VLFITIFRHTFVACDDVTETQTSSDTLLSSAFLQQQGEDEEKEDEGGARGSILETCAGEEKFFSTRETAKSRWPPEYATYRHRVAGKLGHVDGQYYQNCSVRCCDVL